MKHKHYMVLSISEIKDLLAAAQLHRKISDPKDTNDAHCVVLELESDDDPEYISKAGATQITTPIWLRFVG